MTALRLTPQFNMRRLGLDVRCVNHSLSNHGVVRNGEVGRERTGRTGILG